MENEIKKDMVTKYIHNFQKSGVFGLLMIFSNDESNVISEGIISIVKINIQLIYFGSMNLFIIHTEKGKIIKNHIRIPLHFLI